MQCFPLKTLDTIGICQRPVFSHDVSQCMHKITLKEGQTCENLDSIGRRSCKIIMEEKHS